ncbi:hypothetical protein P171DRAFT_479247 [Karstenula rhodostoma CBS 690.94]|uniref:Uncharacterized protein n=1 Tax=Karstenula rhodostoma CBS 690.94 TaxID=1392251 RepID=A0A9P4PWD6_9PLEO|nr:hypothetical protein P171DRAFT_479247 [Karstenula rhodostoma CBS 690.94]
MDFPASGPFSGLACTTTSPLGIAAIPITQLVQAATSDAISQLCDRPTDSMYQINPDSIAVSFSSELVDLTITMPPDGVAQGSATCQTAFSSIAAECFGWEGVWGGDFYDGDFTYAIARAASADSLVETLENRLYGQEAGVSASGFVTATVEASGSASGFPAPSGIVSGYPVDDFPFPTPTATAIASGYYPGPVASGFVPPFPSDFPIASGFVPSGVESGYVAIPTPEAPVFPGWSEDAFAKVRRGSGEREEVEAETRPKARWIMG